MLTRLFCDVDDFCHDFIPQWEATLIENKEKTRKRKRLISHSEIITIVIFYHRSGFRTFKWYYLKYVQKHLQGYFPTLPSYNRFIELMSEILIPLTAFMQSRCHQGNQHPSINTRPPCHQYRLWNAHLNTTRYASPTIRLWDYEWPWLCETIQSIHHR